MTCTPSPSISVPLSRTQSTSFGKWSRSSTGQACSSPVGKDSAVLLHLAVKALRPTHLPFPVLHIDTGHNFPEVIAFRDRVVKRLGVDLVVGSVDDAIASGLIPTPPRPDFPRNRMQTPVLLETLRNGKFTAVLGGCAAR